MSDPLMGTREEAEAALLGWWRKHCHVSRPLMASAKQHRQNDAERREIEVRFREAACLLAWHINGGKPPTEAQPAEPASA